MRKTKPVRPVRFGDEPLSGDEAREVCRSILQDIFGEPHVTVEERDLEGLRGIFWGHPMLSLATVYFPRCPLRLRAPGTRSAGIAILRAMDGAMSLEQRRRRVELARGDVAFVRTDEPLTLSAPEGGRLDFAFLPGHALGAAQKPAFELSMRPVRAECLPLQLLVTYAGYLLQQGCRTGREVEMMVAHFLELLPVLLLQLAEGTLPAGPPADRLSALKAQIELHLTRSTFSILDAASGEGVTPRAIQKLFAREGTTFSRYLLDRRLDLAKTAILLDDTAMQITQIAFDAGFNDPSYFSRAFRHRYGMKPSELRALARP